MILSEEINPEIYAKAVKLAKQKINDSQRTIAKKNSKIAKGKAKLKHTIDWMFIMQLLRWSGCRCIYCGIPFKFVAKDPMNFSIDRIDSSKGYTPDNVQLISTWVNRAKNNLSEKEFFYLISSMNNEANGVQINQNSL